MKYIFIVFYVHLFTNSKMGIMNFKELCRARYSVRAYKPDAIPADKMEYIKECVRLAPSAVNKQPWKFFVIDDEENRRKLQQCYERDWFAQAPAYILVCSHAAEAWTRRYDDKNHADIDNAIAVEHLCLAATEQGLGTCWVCNFRVQLCRELFNLPEELYPFAIIPIGFPAEAETPEKLRKETEDVWQAL